MSTELCQADLVAGCRLQMRGAMNISPFEDRLVPDRGLDELHLNSAIREAGQVVLRFEKARARVYGTWAGWASEPSTGSTYSVSLADALSRQATGQRCCLCAIAGPTGYGKRSFVRALSYDLGRPLKMVHASSVLGASGGPVFEVLTALDGLLRDARLADAVVCIDGFEHILLDEGGAGGREGLHLHVLLSRLLGMLQDYPGCVFLVCHLENPQNISLQRDFASRLFCFIRQSIPLSSVRAKLWKCLMPTGAPLAVDVSYAELGKRFELGPSSIQAAVLRACAESAYRGSSLLQGSAENNATSPLEVVYGASRSALAQSGKSGAECVRMADLLAAGDIEVSKLRDQYFEVTSRMFT